MSDELQVKDAFLQLSDNQLDSSMKILIKKWSNPPKAIEILEVLDKCIFSALASALIVKTLQLLLYDTIENENTSMEILIKMAYWRT